MLSGEDKLIAEYFAPIAIAPGALGLTDDCAFYTPLPGHDLVLTADAIVAGVHFLASDPPGDIARKALRVNLSDLAAKGATPAGCLLTLALPREASQDWIAAFAAGLKADCEELACPLFGGDTVSTPGPLSISITAFGILPVGTMVRRSGARAGDRVFLSGTLGDGALGLHLLRDADMAGRHGLSPEQAEHLVGRYRVPQPRVALGGALRSAATSAMDVSDGLMGDLAKLCAVSGVSGRIQAAALPLSEAARVALSADPSLMETLVTGGDDYEILCTIPPDRVEDFCESAEAVDVAVTQIGEIVAGQEPPILTDAQGATLIFARTSFSHF
jgi:thiamine-monophosphate kinase